MGAAPMDEPMMDDHDHPMMEGEEEELEEVAASSGRKSPHADRNGDDERKRPMQEAVVRQRIRKILKNVKFKK